MQVWQVFFEIPGKPPVELKEGESIIGRSRTSAVHIPETTVSRQHARVLIGAGGNVTVADLGSSNGTFVNGDKVEGEQKLKDGDRVLVGDAEMIIRILAPAEVSDATVRVAIPPMNAPGMAATQRVDVALSQAAVPPPPPPAALGGVTVIAAPQAPMFDRPIDPPLHMDPPPPQRTPTPPPPAPPPQLAPIPPMAPVAPAPRPTPPPPLAPPGGGELLGSIQELEKMPMPPAPVAPAAAKRPGAAPVAAGAPPIFGAVPHAGFWLRVAANLIDSVLLGVVYGILFGLGLLLAFVLPPRVAPLAISLLAGLGGLALGFLLVLYWPATKGWTPGKKMLGLAIYSDETRPGQGLGWGKAFMRLLGHIACSFTFSLGYLMVAFTSNKQGLHDLIAKTYVGKVR